MGSTCIARSSAINSLNDSLHGRARPKTPAGGQAAPSARTGPASDRRKTARRGAAAGNGRADPAATGKDRPLLETGDLAPCVTSRADPDVVRLRHRPQNWLRPTTMSRTNYIFVDYE